MLDNKEVKILDDMKKTTGLSKTTLVKMGLRLLKNKGNKLLF